MPLSETAIQLFSSVKQWIEPAMEAVGKRLDDFDLRLKAIPAGAQGEPGIKGEDGVGIAKAYIDDQGYLNVVRADGVGGKLGKVIGATGDTGPKGDDGKPIDPAVVTELIDKHVALAVALIPTAPAGLNGKDADPEVIKLEVARAVAEIPKPKDGADGLNGTNGKDGLNGENGKAGEPGHDADPALMTAEIQKQFATMAAEFVDGLNDD